VTALGAVVKTLVPVATVAAAAAAAPASAIPVSHASPTRAPLAAAPPAAAQASRSVAAPLARAVAYLLANRRPDGGFGEPGRPSDPGLTAWVALGLRAAGRTPAGAAAYLDGKPYPTATDLELRILALAALGTPVDTLAGRLAGLARADGRIGPAVNSTIWGLLALRTAGRPAPPASVRYLLAAQARSGGWSWAQGVAPDTDDTAAAVQALRASGVAATARPIRRALAFLRARQRPDGGFESARGRGSNAQSTAWAIQAFLAAGREPGAKAFRYLAGLQRPDGSFRLSRRYVTTPVWVTSQVAAALARRPFPLR
jgi:hypothetical protein